MSASSLNEYRSDQPRGSFWGSGSDSSCSGEDSFSLPDEGSDEDPFFGHMPPESSSKNDHTTPVTKLQQMIVNRSPSFNFTRSELGCVNAGLARLQNEIPDESGPHGRSARVREVFSAASRKLTFGAKDDHVDAERKAARILNSNQDMSRTVGQLITIDTEAKKSSPDHPPVRPFVDVDHIFNSRIRGGVISGGHHISPGHALAKTQFDRIDFTSGIYVASIQMQGKVKRATFFPDHLDQEQVLEVIKGTTEIACSDARRLCRGDHIPYYIEVVRVDGLFKTAYPIIFFKRYFKGETYEIKDGSCPMKASMLLEVVNKLIKSYQEESAQIYTSFVDDPVRYCINNAFGERELIVELGHVLSPEEGFAQNGTPRFSQWQNDFRAEFGDALAVSSVPKGLYFQVPQSELQEKHSALVNSMEDDNFLDD